ncbi:alpha/beta hydrolase [Sutcliffiella cohnii]|uniref:alpha/beta hydrolase n=1 Tax=Sutcliffiella cohnii TaxID=33932 RepID=UPI002E22F488|nr:alpha/beta hydrolase [Sutcliffiella cohnii]
MLHEKIEVKHKQDVAMLHTYILDNSSEIDPNRKRPMVVVCPGGGYEFTSDREAEPIAIQLNAMGFHASVLRYSVKPTEFPSALCQLAKTVWLIRKNTDKWNVDSNKIILMGFSAGGHLAASLGVFWNRDPLPKILDVQPEQIKPNGLILSYPVITSGEHAHQGSFRALLGKKLADKALLNLMSLENQVTSHTPPTFLWHTFTDTAVPVENSLLFANALAKHDVSLEMHIYPRGAHGLSLGTEETMVSAKNLQSEVVNWIEMAGRWIKGL